PLDRRRGQRGECLGFDVMQTRRLWPLSDHCGRDMLGGRDCRPRVQLPGNVDVGKGKAKGRWRMVANRMFLSAIAAIGLSLTSVVPTLGQSYPDRMIKIIVPYPAGGPTDVMARLIAQRLAASFGQTVIVDNRPGAGGTTGTKLVASANPD